jgi:hypothetical protein
VNGDQYIAGVLAKYVVRTEPGSGVAIALAEVIPSVKRWANQYLNAIGPSGSLAKGTAVAGTTDVDVFISIKNNVPEDLGEIYESLYRWAAEHFWIPNRQNVSIGISWLGTKVDLVPGRVQGILTTDHSLWKNKQQTWKQTNITTHINTVRNAGRLNEIRALKIWRRCHSLEFPSFYLELTVINALWGRPKGVNLAANVSACLEYIRDSLGTACVIDPANTNNVISDDLTGAEKKRIAEQAGKSRNEPYWRQVLW